MDLPEIFTQGLNPQQAEAVSHIEGPLLILAGAGSGKTRVLTYRLAHLICSGEATPDEILAVTFTNKAAKEMENRSLKILQNLGVPYPGKMWISTFHSICVRILREDIDKLGYTGFFVIYDSDDQLSVIKKLLNSLKIKDSNLSPKTVQNYVNNLKIDEITPENYLDRAPEFMNEKFFEIYKNYERQMKNSNALDFSDLLLKTLILFEKHPEVLEKYTNSFRFIMVDEYQDTNRIQYKIVKLLAEKHRNICVVGDEDQSIYSWRGADIRNILDFEKDFGSANVVKLEENYRSTKTIVSAASHLIKNNTQRKEKTLFTNNIEGEKIVVREEQSEYDEGRMVASKIKEYLSSGEYSPSDIAVFYRMNAQSRVIEENLRNHSIPYRLIGGMRFYERMEIKDILSYMRLVINLNDDVALSRVLNVPARGIGKVTLTKIELLAREEGVSLYTAIKKAIDKKLFNKGTSTKLFGFIKIIEELKSYTEEATVSDVYHHILDRIEYTTYLYNQYSTDAEARIENLQEFDNAIRHFQKERNEESTLINFLEEMALLGDTDNTSNDESGVTLMTLHISKGLEFPIVFIIGMEDGIFPSRRTIESMDSTEMEEERRLAYVGITRAQKKLFLTYARNRRLWGTPQNFPPSQFIDELPSEYMDQESSVFTPKFLDRYKEKYLNNESSSGYRSFSEYQNESFPEYEDQSQEYDTEANGTGLKKGLRVRHPTFGAGTIYKSEGEGERQKVTVLFQDNSLRKFMVKYARLEII